MFIAATVDSDYVGGIFLCNLYIVAVGCVYNCCGGMKGAEEGFVIKNGCGAAAIHDDKLVVTVSV